MPESCPFLNKILGLEERISRRDFLDGALLASGAALLAGTTPRQIMAQSEGWTGYTGEGDYKGSAGNTEEVVHNAHAVRDGAHRGDLRLRGSGWRLFRPLRRIVL